ncbi:MAG: bifunctional (p)ppGpp synthetase/guanosine-3',5'-bis(diphosphate) 3'-pyrophosphohydrolase [Bacteroidaceae bacterium]|jgi:GTP pyrophosphokinase|nr:bifunctional (p)ppGpp synthetase/guanosine-3',5'-bis(diphosphate) 3'-pyrophosphohydrolase [Bacteroidaceae bacterium]MBR3619004.1 bifunctional (p)ppGpp synthetase/guanosine-3',5'-bis(diphosphate) 3'-pyrophosphohydrolase [Bacteroidaceae bacterium]
METTMANSELEEKLINDEFQKLIDAYLASKHRKKVDIITKAFNFARHAHKGVRRLSGEPYILHPISVAQIVCIEIGLGSTSICSALLHDVVEDTDYTVEDIANMFGPKIAQIVEGLTKISGGIFGDHASAQAENFKKLLLTMSDDIRVILIKIADRLHNMRTLGSQAVNKQYKIAGETLYIYAPLANRLGLNSIKTELEDLSFKFEHPDEYGVIESKLKATQEERDSAFEKFVSPIRAELDKLSLNYEIKQRVKSPYSIWHKMQTKHIPFEEIYDILAVRIIFDPEDIDTELNDCFDIYVKLCKIYTSHPDRTRDWVSHPKANGYQALHVTLMSKQGEWIEVQIRSRRMDDIAEKGFAAHWKYKDGDKTETASEMELDKWLATIKEILDDPQPDAMDFLDTIKLNLFASEIFVFTPKGEIRTMPAGSTTLDFAFSIHTFVGSHCIGAKVNHKLEPINYVLQSGDQVEILTSKSAHPTREWLNIATTAKATTKIVSILKKTERDLCKRGELMMDEFLANNDIQKNTSVIDKLCRMHGSVKPDALYVSIAEGKIVLGKVDLEELKEKGEEGRWKKLFSFGKKAPKQEAKKATVDKNFDKKKAIKLTEESIQNQYTLCDCCKPIPGDKVMGYIDDDKHIVVHKLQCPNAEKLKANRGNRVLAAEWEMGHVILFPVSIYVKGFDKLGLLHKMTQVISQLHGVNIRKLEVESDNGIFECTVQIFVHDTKDADAIITSLREIQDIKEVARI